MPARVVLWWGRFDPDYSRNRVVRRLLADLGWRIVDFHPTFGPLGDVEAALRRMPPPDLVWVPCFRQRDAAAAARWAKRRKVPLLFDPLISAWDKQVFEREKFDETSRRAQALLAREHRLFASADLVLADTEVHREFFMDRFGLAADRVAVVPVGAEETLFAPSPPRDLAGRPVEVLFYGSFIGLQGPQTIVEAARLYAGPPVVWHLLGEGPLLAECRKRAAGLSTVYFEPWLPYGSLPARIGRADILLGVFGASRKAGRVIPNKVFQALACGRPVITRASPAYPAGLEGSEGIAFIPPDDPKALASAVAGWAEAADRLTARGDAAARIYQRHFGYDTIRERLRQAMAALRLEP